MEGVRGDLQDSEKVSSSFAREVGVLLRQIDGVQDDLDSGNSKFYRKKSQYLIFRKDVWRVPQRSHGLWTGMGALKE